MDAQSNAENSPVSDFELMEAAREARTKAYAPYSNYHVGASVATDIGVFQGANIEVSGRTTSVHAEMMAMFNAVMAGAKEFDRLAVSPEGETGEAICGLCQHTVAQFCEDLLILEDIGKDDEFVEYSLKELIGPAFSPSTLDYGNM